MRNNLFAFLLTLSLFISSGFAQAVRITPAERRMADAITADQLKNYLYFVASDAMEGRDTPSRGLDVTAEFLKMNLSRWGFKPAGDNGTYFQKIELTMESVDAVNNILQVDGKTFNLNSDFFRISGSGSANALMVFAGNGWMVKSKNIDAYRGVDVRGKIVVLMGQGFVSDTLVPMPAGISQTDLTGTKGTDWADPLTYAASKGAAGVILIGSPQVQSSWGRLRQFFSRGNLYPTKLREPRSEPAAKLPVALVSNGVAETIFAGASAGKDSPTPFAIDKTV